MLGKFKKKKKEYKCLSQDGENNFSNKSWTSTCKEFPFQSVMRSWQEASPTMSPRAQPRFQASHGSSPENDNQKGQILTETLQVGYVLPTLGSLWPGPENTVVLSTS